jgi:O-acetylhomoserine/O-acetylserine sulfhydrylase-like pyridoxal-dependent enzyme
MSTKKYNPETIAIHGGDYRSDPTTNAVAVPIIELHHINLIAQNTLQICLH